ncbi:hypothetical protein TNCV_521921 [Trichonephila clavipes]|nr:hypothetical protein TNCV_521921 [Trichonephila clavipes]
MCLPSPLPQKAYDGINVEIADLAVMGPGRPVGIHLLLAVCTLIGSDSGKVLNMEVMSFYCKGCDSYKGSKCEPKYSAFFG